MFEMCLVFFLFVQVGFVSSLFWGLCVFFVFCLRLKVVGF